VADPKDLPTTDDYADLKADARVQAYVTARLRGQGTELARVKAQLEQAASGASGALSEALEAEGLRAAVLSHVDALTSQLPPQIAALVPRSLPPSELLAWVSQNLPTLTAPAEQRTRTVLVHGGGGRSDSNGLTPDPGARAVAEATARCHRAMRRAVPAWMPDAGDGNRRGGR
jgi:hypothetical protein